MRRFLQLCVTTYVFLAVSELSEASVFDRLNPQDIQGPLDDYLAVTDIAMVTEAKLTELKYRAAFALDDLKATGELESIYKKLLTSRAVSDQQYDFYQLRHDLANIEVGRAKTAVEEFAALKDILNLREGWERLGQPNDGKLLQAKYILLWEKRCSIRTMEYSKADKTYVYAKKQYDRGIRLHGRNAVTREEVVELEIKLKAAENDLKARYDLTTECTK